MSAYASKAYLQAAVQQEHDPKKLILMLYEGALKHVRLAKEGILAKNARQRGENLSRAIAIISALHAALDEKVRDEPIEFLRGLYVSMMLALSRVAVTHDVETLERAARYLERLRDIWQHEVMGKPDAANAAAKDTSPPQAAAPLPFASLRSGYAALAQARGRLLSVS
ncbi:MAG: hypothetical protein KatS3mg131_1308 [Candidatus Tectimicrobiota bacterium]|nr:MAG: hypothetical protein KatS3mg131_1308 [Candidatus Tectomicrobia bacterium]